MRKKGQITVFIIIGIVIIAVFGFIFYISQEVSRIKLETEANRIIDSVLATTPLNYYVTLCVEESTKEALGTVGDQGGVVSLAMDPNPNPFVSYEWNKINIKEQTTAKVRYDVAYSVMRWNKTLDLVNEEGKTDLNISPCNSKMSNMPVPAYNVFDGSLNTPQNCLTYPELCKSPRYLDSINWWNKKPAYCKFKNNLTAFPYLPIIEYGRADFIMPLCKPGQCLTDLLKVKIPFSQDYKTIPIYAEGTTSMQAQLEERIAGLVDQCVKFEEVEAFRTALNITKHEISINLTMADNGIDVMATFPLTIRIQDYEPVIRILQFKGFVPVRLKPIYKLSRYLAEKENSDLNFSMETDWTSNQYYNPDFTLEILKTGKRTLCSATCTQANPQVCTPVCTETSPTDLVVPGGDRIIRINDTNKAHYLRNGPFTYQFAIQNRPPALDYISDNPSGSYDIVAVEGQTIAIKPNATDPDGELVTYSYSGWKETWNETFDETNHAVKYVIPSKHEWTTSIPWGRTLSAANYTTKHEDIGPHNVTVCAKDSYGQSDCQTIRILVDDFFVVDALRVPCKDSSGIEFYGTEFRDNVTSFEDPLCLKAVVTDFFSTGPVKYKWKIVKTSGGTGEIIYNQGDSSIIELPRDYDSARNNINGIKNYFEDITNAGGTGIYTLTVNVTKNPDNPTTAEDTVNLTFYKCLPHTGSGSPYPFSSSVNPYLADHTCCIPDILTPAENSDPPAPSVGGWGSYATPPERVCYPGEQKLYGCYNANFGSMQQIPSILADNALNIAIINGERLPDPEFTLSDLSNPDFRNDVFMRYLNGTCSSERGNTCTGTVYEVRRKMTLGCADKAAGESETCSGCSLTPAGSYDSGTACVSSPSGKTWEQQAGIEGATGICNDHYKCVYYKTSKYSDYVDPSHRSRFACKSTCDGNGHCDAVTDCEDCWDASNHLICSGPVTSTPFEAHTINAITGGCNPAPTDNFCDDNAEILTDFCYNDYTLIDYACKLPDFEYGKYVINQDSGYEYSPVSYEKTTINCQDYAHDQAPIVSGLADSMQTCSGGKVSKCVAETGEPAACQNSASMTDTPTLTEYCDANFYYDVQPTGDVNSNSKPDSCEYLPSSISSTTCTRCNGQWNDETSQCQIP